LDERKKLSAVKAKLGQPRSEARQKGEYGFLCPGSPGKKCSSAAQGKVRLWVNPETDRFNCWHCGFKGSSLSALMVNGSAEQREYLAEREESPKQKHVEVLRPPCESLPDGFTPFCRSKADRATPYTTYLSTRGVTERTVALYRMGYVDTGQLAGRVIIPSFDLHGSINFWSARSIYPNETLRYRLPKASKDIISNEHMVDWTKPVYLVEGIFDEIAIGSQAIALYGKFIPPKLMLRLVERRPPAVYICLDDDARDEAYGLAKKLIGYDVKCCIVDLNGKDPGQVGSAGVAEAVQRAAILTGSAGLLTAKGII